MTNDVDQTLLVLTNMPDQDSAVKLAQALVEKRLAACVNVLNGCTSVYRWRQTVQTEREVTLLIKTRAERYSDLEQQILDLHPYELPEVIAVNLNGGYGPYIEWVANEVTTGD